MYAAIATVDRQALASPALLRATQIKLELGKVTPLQAATVFDGLRYRWRGDATELETIRALGQLYLGQGRYREALEALRSAGSRLPDLPEALQLQADRVVRQLREGCRGLEVEEAPELVVTRYAALPISCYVNSREVYAHTGLGDEILEETWIVV